MTIFSFIMPVYNVEKYLKRSIESVLSQEHEHWELLIIDDGSTDKSGEICKEYAGNHEQIKYFYQENQGSGMARNKGLENAQGRYISFIDSDDYIKANIMKDKLIIIEEFEPELIANGHYELPSDNGLIEREHLKMNGLYYKNQFRNNFNNFEKVNSKALWNKMYQKLFLDENKIRFTDQGIGQDALFNYEVYKHLDKIYVNQKSYYVYDTTREDSATGKYNSNKVKYELNIVDKYIEMFSHWNRIEEHKKNIARAYFRILTTELVNLNRHDCPDSYKIKTQKIKSLLKAEEMVESLSVLGIENMNTPLLKSTFILAKNNNSFLLIGLYKFYVAVKL